MNRQDIHRVYNLSAIFQRDESIRGWTVHCLDFDVVTCGNTPEHAMDMLMEALGMVAADDLLQGREPTERNAPRELWTPYFETIKAGQSFPLDALPAKAQAVAIQIRWFLTLSIEWHGLVPDIEQASAPERMSSRYEIPALYAAMAA